ncbi:hypothetical protein [Gemmobacter caeruleus]|uniref:hypothetical protein n=1 Tax=Gemmobacter caeruleus TaxID=2595004 RepID=UPI0011EC76C9|nr:hypothetical protein [Gemmobacter caeruleus]
MPVQRALIQLLQEIDASLDLMEAVDARAMGPLWPGLLARRRRAAILLRHRITRARPRPPAARGPGDGPITATRLVAQESRLLALFDAAARLPDLSDDLRQVLRGLRNEVEQARQVLAHMPS